LIHLDADFFEHFLRRPEMYTGEKNLCALRTFLSGYEFALTTYGVSNAQQSDYLFLSPDFHDWVAYRLHFYETTSGWCNMICDQFGNEQPGIDRFFELLAEFKSRKPHVVAKVDGVNKSHSSQAVTRDENGKMIFGPTTVKSYPKSIMLVTYTDDPGFFAYSEPDEEFPERGFHPNKKHFELWTGDDQLPWLILDDQWLNAP